MKHERSWAAGAVASAAAIAAAVAIGGVASIGGLPAAAFAVATEPAAGLAAPGSAAGIAARAAVTKNRDSASSGAPMIGAAAVSLDVWAQGDTVDVLWAAPRAASEGEAGSSAGGVTRRTGSATHGTGAATHGAVAGYDLFHARSLDGGRTFGAATRIGAGWAEVHNPHRGTDPQIAAAGDHLVAVWTAPGTSSWGSGPLAVAISPDGGRTWRPGANPADDGTTEGHGFIDVAAEPGGAFHAVWLDGRDGFQGLRFARSEDGGATWRPNADVDARTCECCWNDLTVLGGGRLAVLYRDHDPRDMAVAVSEDGGRSWSRRGVAGDFDWAVDGCPHVGGGLAGRTGPARGDETTDAGADELHALVWTGADERAGLYHVRSRDSGATWGPARGIGSARAKHGDLAAGATGRLWAVWDEAGAIHAASSRDGETWSAARRWSDASVVASHPLVVAVGAGALVVWTESAQGAASSRWMASRLE